ncbi:MAG: leucine--tRNA ligase [Chloroflexi bacterium]|nr:leucine--tRNA ligase [Chloroflexota bacterium]
MGYNPKEIEKKWQVKWETDGLYHTKDNDPRPKWYSLTMFPYTSGDLHIGHWYSMAPPDVFARYKRMQGYNVLFPMGFDAFGLPAENAAIKRGIHPYKWTMDNIERMRLQIKSLGAIFDWSREIITCKPEYYKWTEWFFLKLYEAGLAYRTKAPANWCPECQTVRANEQVLENGTCERCNTMVTRKDLEQWFFRVTKYAEQLMEHKNIDWPDRVKLMQRNWVGKSIGADLSFTIEGGGEFSVFTTRPDTIFGVTFVVLAPEHPLVQKLTTIDQKPAVTAYIEATRRQSEIQRLSTDKEKTGVPTGSYAINRLNGERVPIWIGDYVLMSYGTGVVMAVPAHDTRDFAMAKKYNLPIKIVIAPPEWNGEELEDAYVDEGIMVNSGHFNSLTNEKGKEAITDFVHSKGWGKKTVSYRLRDWLISRQRYWGAPIPIIYCDKCGIVPVPEKDLPVLLPEDAEFRPTGESPLKYCESFVNTTCPKCGGAAKRETDTMDTFMCSSWYMYRYPSPQYDKAPFDPAKVKKWMPVDLYTGGVEHANMHLFYSRFFCKAIRDMGMVDFDEPFLRLFNQGIILHEHQKMSKSKGNVVNPDKYVETLGADTVRAYLMFVGPWELGGNWDDTGINGITRWFNRIWSLVTDKPVSVQTSTVDTKELRHMTHKTIKKVSNDLEKLHFNTMLAALMEYTNYLIDAKDKFYGTTEWDDAMQSFMLMMSPTTPHLAEELWAQTGRSYSIHNQCFPAWDEKLAAEEEVTLILQVNGKVRDRLNVAASISEAEAKQLALNSDRLKTFTDGKTIANIIYVHGKLVNIVVK